MNVFTVVMSSLAFVVSVISIIISYYNARVPYVKKIECHEASDYLNGKCGIAIGNIGRSVLYVKNIAIKDKCGEYSRYYYLSDEATKINSLKPGECIRIYIDLSDYKAPDPLNLNKSLYIEVVEYSGDVTKIFDVFNVG